MNRWKRKSIRLKGYDYSKEGFYFITISTYKNGYLFGEIIDGEMKLNDAGEMVEKLWMKSEEIRDIIKLHNFIIMPNHLHGIIEIIAEGEMEKKGDDGKKGVCDTPVREKMESNGNNHVGAYRIRPNECPNESNKLISPKNTIGSVIRGFKSSTTKEIRIMYDMPLKKISQKIKRFLTLLPILN